MKNLLILLFICTFVRCDDAKSSMHKVLVFSKTAGFRHESISSGIKMMKKLGVENEFEIVATESSNQFTTDNLKSFKAIVFLNTTGDVLNDPQQKAMENFIQNGGGFLGIHSAADTEHDWPWFGKMVGAYFKDHPNDPNVRPAEIDCLNSTHTCCKHLPKRWKRTDEWYNYKDINTDVNVVLNLDENSYEGGTNGENHPIAWYHEYDGGRAFYTGGGHTHEAFEEPDFVQHVLGALRYVVGKNE